jgi:hypothetical protein
MSVVTSSIGSVWESFCQPLGRGGGGGVTAGTVASFIWATVLPEEGDGLFVPLGSKMKSQTSVHFCPCSSHRACTAGTEKETRWCSSAPIRQSKRSPILLRMFEKRLRGYRAIGYARDEAPLGLRQREDADALVVERDDEALSGVDDDFA